MGAAVAMDTFGHDTAEPPPGARASTGLGPGPYADPLATPERRNWAVVMHLSLLFVLVGVPILPALALWLIKRHDADFLDDHGKEALNFQVSLLIYTLAAAALAVVCVGVLLAAVVPVLGVIGMILAAVAASRGEYYRYPMCVRLFR